MKNADVFEVVILENPLTKEADDGALPTIKCGPIVVVARDAQAAAVSAALDSKTPEIDRDRMEILVRPFGF